MRSRSFDWYTLIPVLLLLCIGIIMVLSASSATTAAAVLKQEPGNPEKVISPFFYFNKQLSSVFIGLVGMFIMSTIDYRKWKQCVKPAFLIAIILLSSVFLFEARNGAHGWIIIGNRQFQPSEFVKLCLILILANIISVKKEKLGSFEEGVLPNLLSIGAICGLIILQPDFGSALVMGATSFAMLFAGGVRTKHLVSLFGAGIGLVTFAVIVDLVTKSYRLARYIAFIDPFKDPRGIGYQIIQSLYAIGSGGLFGVGLGRSMQKYGHIPEQHTDFIFSILAEELGFIGASFVILLFIYFGARGYLIALNSRDTFGSLLATGITTLILVEAIINIAVATSSMPVTGLTLPFISFGGSSLIFKLAAIGVLLNISKYAKPQQRFITEEKAAS